jgi:hypothetical protein
MSEDRSRERLNARLNLLHATEFTKIENRAAVGLLRGWVNDSGRQDDEIRNASNDLWSAVTLLEHFASKLNEDPKTRTEENHAIKRELQLRAQAAEERLVALLPGDEEASDAARMNADADKAAQEILEKLGL